MNLDREDFKGEEHAFAEKFGARLRALRPDGDSQADFARKIGISVTALGTYERGERVPPILVLRRIAEITGADVAELLGLKGTVATGSPEPQEAPGIAEPGRTWEGPESQAVAVAESGAGAGATPAPRRQPIDKVLFGECLDMIAALEPSGTATMRELVTPALNIYELCLATGRRPHQIIKPVPEG